MRRIPGIIVPILATLLALPASADSKLFTRVEKQLIRDYFTSLQDAPPPGQHKQRKGKKQKGLPPGLAKRTQLPPGLQKQLQRNGHLPPGLRKRALPNDLEARLPALPEGQQRVLVDNDLYLIEQATGLILDLMEDLF